MQNLKENIEEIKKIPTGREFTDLLNLYKVIPTKLLDSYVKAFDRKLSDGYNGRGNDVYGQGAYLSLTLEGASHLLGHYGDCVIQVKLLGGLRNFLFFDADRDPVIRSLQIQTYGKPLDIYGQLLEITGNESVARKYTAWDASSFGRRNQAAMRREGYNIRGMVYYWNGNPTVLPFNFGDVITCAAAPHLYRGISSEEIKQRLRGVLDANSRKTQSEWFDTIPQMEMLDAARENQPYKRCAADGNIYVPYERRGGGHFNLVKIDEDDVVNPKPQFVIPKNVRLDEMPSLPNDEGIFYFSSNGIDWQGIVNYPGADIPAYYCEEDDSWYSFDDFEYGLNLAKASKRVAETVANRRKMLSEAFSPDMTAAEFFSKNSCTVYVCAHANSIKGLFQNGFSRQFANSNDYMHNGGSLTYGDGVYGTPSLENAANRLSRKTDPSKSDGMKYGGVIVKCILVGGWNKFLIFDERLAKIVYKDKWQILDQVDAIISDPAARNELKNFCRQYMGRALYNPEQDPMQRTNHVLYNMFNNPSGFKKWTEFFRQHGIRGGIYHGHGDGYAFVCYNYSEVIPVAASYDHGNTFTNKDFDYETMRQRMMFDNDVMQKIGHLYKNVSKFSKKVTCNGKTFGLTNVETKNGKFNMVFNDTGRKISRYDFDSAPVVSSDGVIEFEYGGYAIQGVVSYEGADIPAFYFEPEDSWYSFDDLKEVIENYNNND